MNKIYKILVLVLVVVCVSSNAHVEELEAHLPCPLLPKQECPLLG